MSIFPIHTPETAPEQSKPILDKAKGRYGFVPNLLGGMAEAPATLEAYTTLGPIFEKAALDVTERQVIMLTVSRHNGCTYCVAAHSTMAGMQKVPEDVIDAIREGKPIADAKLEALRAFVQIMLDKQGWASEEEIQAFLAAGYTRQNVLEVVLGIAFKTISNYTNHLVGTPLDERFSARAWQAREAG